MAEKLISVGEAAEWLCRAVAIDGVLSPKEKDLLRWFANTYGINHGDLIEQARRIADQEESEVALIKRNMGVGHAFESFMVDHICHRPNRVDYRFRLLRWRSDKATGRVAAMDMKLPDLELIYLNERGKRQVMVECKYRHDASCFPYFESKQMIRYLRAGIRHKVPVFVAVGLGGKPDDPERLFIVPVRLLVNPDYGKLNRFELQPPFEPMKIINFLILRMGDYFSC